MRKIMKRGFCLFLVAVLLAGLVPYAFADETKPTETAEVSEAATEPTEETAETIEPEEDEIADGQLLPDSISTYASTVSNVLLFDQASPNYTTVLKSQISVTYQPNGTDAAKTAYIKNLGWHFARYNNVPYEDDPIYCIEPCKNYAASTSGNYMDQDLGVSGSGSSRGSNVWYAMPSSYRQAIALTLLYSKQLWNSNYSVKTTAMANNPNVSTRIATQFLIYEIVTGLRDADTFNRKSSNGYTSGDVFYNAGVANVSGFAGKYNSIVSSVQNAMKVPSFTSRSSGSAPTITMSGSQVSVTDSNGVLGNFSFANGNGASFSKSGNTLTITKTGTISPSTVFSATRSLPSAENSTVSIYYSASSTYQKCVKMYSTKEETLRTYKKKKAPDFELPDQNGEMHKLSDYAGKKVILYFYPKDNTPGCTKQACGFSERYPQFTEKGAVILGVSKDSVASHKRFEEKYGLAFTLLADPERKVIEAYDVWKEKKNYGKVSMGVVRTTYLIDEQGIIIKANDKVKAADDPENMLKELA